MFFTIGYKLNLYCYFAWYQYLKEFITMKRTTGRTPLVMLADSDVSHIMYVDPTTIAQVLLRNK